MTHYIALSKTAHQSMGWRKAPSLSFAATESVVAVLLEEVPHLVPTLPLAFIQRGAADGSSNAYELVALLSLSPGLNLYLSPDGRWLGGYLPAALRSYPFRLLQDNESERVLLCFDQDSGLMSSLPDAAAQSFFDTEGKMTPGLENLVTFLKLYEQGRQLTQVAVNLLAEHNLIVPWSVSVGDGGGQSARVNGLHTIDEQAVKNLDSSTLKLLMDGNALSLAYAQLFAQHRVQNLSRLYDLRKAFKDGEPIAVDKVAEDLLSAHGDTLKFQF